LKHNWPLIKYVENYIARCETCQKNKLKERNKGVTGNHGYSLTLREMCFRHRPINDDHGNKYILTFHNLTKFSKAIPIPNQEIAKIAKQFTFKIIFEYGIPDKVLTDQGKLHK